MSTLKASAMPGETRWESLDVAFRNYRHYINSKTDQDALTLIDLLYIRNFKGGNASITDPEDKVSERLKLYSEIVGRIRRKFRKPFLEKLTDDQLQWLIEQAIEFINLPLRTQSQISGFGPSYASAMLAAHFPDLIPIIDRNILLGTGIIRELPRNGQIHNIEQHYGPLLKEFHRRVKAAVPRKIRDLDRQLFILGSKKVKELRKGNDSPQPRM
jgi:hypothetical protein